MQERRAATSERLGRRRTRNGGVGCIDVETATSGGSILLVVSKPSSKSLTFFCSPSPADLVADFLDAESY